jgi:hypothetical protein
VEEWLEAFSRYWKQRMAALEEVLGEEARKNLASDRVALKPSRRECALASDGAARAAAAVS